MAVAVSYVVLDWYNAVSRVVPWRWDRPFLILMVLLGPLATFAGVRRKSVLLARSCTQAACAHLGEGLNACPFGQGSCWDARCMQTSWRSSRCNGWWA